MPTVRMPPGFTVLRLTVAALLGIHGTYRALHQGFVAGFGEFLASQGIPMASLLAGAITAWEILGAAWLASGWRTRPVATVFAAELALGVLLVHAGEGWFVVGGGRNGMEYSVLLIVCLLVVGWGRPDAERRG